MIDHRAIPDSRRCERRSSKYRWDSRRRSCATAKARRSSSPCAWKRAVTSGMRERPPYAIAHSPLVKTAFFASDPNLGRLLAAIGKRRRARPGGRPRRPVPDEVLVSKGGGRAPSYREEDGKA